MIRSSFTSWQVTLADLSLILFLVTLAGIAPASDSSGGEEMREMTPSQALFQSGLDSPNFTEWLAMQHLDDRMTLMIHVQHPAGDQEWAFVEAMHMVDAARSASVASRVVIDQGRQRASYASLGYDLPQISPPMDAGGHRSAD